MMSWRPVPRNCGLVVNRRSKRFLQTTKLLRNTENNTKDDLSQGVSEQDDFSVSRPLHSGKEDMTSTEKERMIFSKIFDSILSQKGSPDVTAKKNKNKNRSAPIASSLQALFEQSVNDNSSNIKLEMTTGKFSRKATLSAALSSKPDVKGRSEQNKDLERVLQPVLDHIDSFKYDYEVVDYYVNQVLKRYNGPQYTSKKGVDSAAVDPQNPPLYGSALAIYLLCCMKALAKSFNEPAEAISLFEMSKQKSIEFYAQSCTADVYNLVLMTRWETYRDLYAVEAAVSEMHVNAVLVNSETVYILSQITRDTIDAKHGMLGSNNIALWNREDERRIQKLGQYKLRMLSVVTPRDPFSIPLNLGDNR